MVEAIGVTKSFGDLVAVSDVTFQIGSGITAAVLGPNGAGKGATLFRRLCGLHPAVRGRSTARRKPPRLGSAVASVLHRRKTASSTDSPCSTS